MKKCCKCLNEKPLDEFTNRAASSDGKHSRCKTCTRSASMQHYLKNRSYYVEKQRKRRLYLHKKIKKLIRDRKAKPCMDCKKTYPHFVMDFDHVSGNKKFAIANTLRYTDNIELLEEELSKCELVCSNCHRFRTYERRTGRSFNR
jgi:hypothetical protein